MNFRKFQKSSVKLPINLKKINQQIQNKNTAVREPTWGCIKSHKFVSCKFMRISDPIAWSDGIAALVKNIV